MIYNFCGGAYKTFSPNLNAQECVNFESIVDKQSGKSIVSLRGTPGLKEWVDTGKYAEVRGSHKMGSYLYVIVGNAVFWVATDGTKIECTGTLSASSGTISETMMADNGTQLMIVDGINGYTITGTVLTQITDTDFPNNPTSVTYQDGYFVVTRNNSGRVYISDLNDGTSWDGTMYFNAEAKPDNLLTGISNHRILSLFGSDTIESWYNSGATVPFDRQPGSTQEIGIGAAKSLASLENTIYFLSNNLQVCKIEGYNPQIVSTPAVEYQMAQYLKTDDAIGFGYTHQGHAYYVLTFPTGNATWVYDVSTGFWHMRASYPSPYENRWRANCHSYFAGKHIVGDYQNGKLYELDYETHTDNGETIKRVRTSAAIHKDRKNIFLHEFEIEFEAGVGLSGGVQGEDPQAMLQWSKDDGHTWGNEIWRSIGKIGKYKDRARWLRNGSARSFVPKLTISDPVKCVIVGANIEASGGIH